MSVVAGRALRRDVGGWHVELSCDSQLSGATKSLEECKVGVLGDAVVGWIGSPLWGSFVRAWNDELSDLESVERFAEAWWDWARLRGHGAMHGLTYVIDGFFLIGTPSGGLFEVTSDAAVCRHTEYAAIGSGGAVALGALFSGERSGMAVSAAIAHGPHCGGDVATIITRLEAQ